MEAKIQKHKISNEFDTRLKRLKTKEKVRAIVLLNIKDIDKSNGKRQNRTERLSTIEAIRKASMQTLDGVEEILNRFDGRLLTDYPDALGSIHVEITADGIKALAESDCVRAIIEDQKVYFKSQF
ncbi:MAG: hypothetical protein AAB116_20730 [Candidatus Poribacteria bacterium]